MANDNSKECQDEWVIVVVSLGQSSSQLSPIIIHQMNKLSQLGCGNHGMQEQ